MGLKFIGTKELKTAVGNYLDGKDYSVPFIVVGYTGIGKTAVINEALKERNLIKYLEGNAIAHDNVGHCDVLDYSILSTKSLTREDFDLIYSSCNGKYPVIIELTVEFEGEARSLYESYKSIDWYVCRQTFEEFLEYAKQPDPTTHHQRVDNIILDFLELNPECLDSNLTRDKEIMKKIQEVKDQIIKAVEEKDIDNAIELANKVIACLRFISLDVNDVKSVVEDIVNKMKEQLPNLDSGKQVAALRFVMSLIPILQ